MRKKGQICNLECNFGIGTFMFLSMGLLLNFADLGDLRESHAGQRSGASCTHLSHRSDPFLHLLLLHHFDSLFPTDIPNCELITFIDVTMDIYNVEDL